jgi:hypothetical protein
MDKTIGNIKKTRARGWQTPQVTVTGMEKQESTLRRMGVSVPAEKNGIRN